MRNPKIWIASDIHLGHKMMNHPHHSTGEPLRSIGYEDKFIKAWKDCVNDKDYILLLGDIAFSNIAMWFEIMSNLPGKKGLVLGNHDKNKISWYKKWGFETSPFGQSVVYPHQLGNILFTHIPAYESVLTTYDDRFKGIAHRHNKEFDGASCILNIHGHTHGKAKERHNTFDASLEVIQYQPVLLDQIVEMKFK